MTDRLTGVAQSIYTRDLPGEPRSAATRRGLMETITNTFPDAEFAGHGKGRIVVWLPSIPHRELTEDERSTVHDGVVVKFAYNVDHDDDGLRQNRTEASIWEQGSPVIDTEYLAPVLGTGTEQKWLIMPYRDLIPSTAQFEDMMLEIFGELPTGDLGAKSSWGLTGENTIECCDYGRCPITTKDDSTNTHANISV
jgi:hypothetical protein